MIRRLTWPCVCVAVLLSGATTAAQGKVLHRRELAAALSRVLDSADFSQAMTFKDFLGRLQNRLKVQGCELPVVVDTEAFKDGNQDAPDIADTQVKFPAYPKQMTGAAFLSHALAAIPTGNATYFVKNGVVVVTTLDRAQARQLMSEAVEGKFEAQPLGDILQELAAQTGLHLMVDSRVAWKLRAKASANFTVNQTALGTALFVLTDMVDLRVGLMGNVAYITSPANARQCGEWLANGNFEAGRHGGSRSERLDPGMR